MKRDVSDLTCTCSTYMTFLTLVLTPYMSYTQTANRAMSLTHVRMLMCRAGRKCNCHCFLQSLSKPAVGPDMLWAAGQRWIRPTSQLALVLLST